MKFTPLKIESIRTNALLACVAGIAAIAISGCSSGPSDHDVGYVDGTGKLVIPRQFDDAQDFSEGLAAVSVKGQWGYIDTTGKLVIAPQYDRADHFSDGYAAVASGEKWGFIDKHGKMVIAPQFQAVGAFSEGLAPVAPTREDEGTKFIDTTGKVVWASKEFVVPSDQPPFGPGVGFSEGLIQALDSESLKNGYLAKDGKVAINASFDEAQGFSEGVAAVQKDGLWGYIDKTGAWVISPKFQDARPFTEGVAAVGVKGTWRFIDKKGSQAFYGEFDTVEPFSDKVARVGMGSRQGWIDHKGKFVAQSLCGSLHDGRAVFPSKTWADQVGKNKVQVMVVYAVHAIAAGQVVKEDDVEARNTSAQFLPDDVIIAFKGAIGKKARAKINDGQMFRKGLLE